MTTDLPDGNDLSRCAWATADDGVVTSFEFKPDEPSGDRVWTEGFACDDA